MEAELMTWNRQDRRWHKGYKGKRYAISPRQLKTPATKEASRKAANDWWTKKQAEIDEQLGQAKDHPTHVLTAYQQAIENHRTFARWHRRFGDPQQAEKSENIVDWLNEQLKHDDPPYPLSRWQADPLAEVWNDEAAFMLWQERYRQIRRSEAEEQAVPRENTIRAHLDDYLVTVKSQAQARRKLGTYDTVRTRLNCFRKWVDPTAPIESLNESLWERFCLHLTQLVTNGDMAAETRAGTQRAVRAFVRNRYERRMLDLPRNLTSRSLAAPSPLQDVVTFDAEEIKTLLDAATERTQLYLLLMLNCGFYPVDIANLKQSEVDWEAGRIKRKRSKTQGRSKKVPKVDYPLWRRTFALLQKFRSDHPDLVLLNENGQPLWTEQERNGTFLRNNNVKTAYWHLREKISKDEQERIAGRKLKRKELKPPSKDHKPLKAFRKTSASMLENHDVYGRYAEYFLGEAPSSVAGRHYIRPSTTQFNAAIRWLGEQYGID